MTTYDEATNLMYSVVVNAIKSAESIYGYVPQMLFNNRGPLVPPDSSKVWARIGRTTNQEEQGTLSTCEGAPGQKRYDSYGLIWIQIFAPMADPNADTKVVQFATILRDSFRGVRTNDVWYRNAKVVEAPNEDTTIRYNVISEYEYSENQ